MAHTADSAALRVLFLITDLGKGGAERFLIDLCRALRNRPGVEFVIGSLFDDNQYRDLTAGLPIAQLHYTPFSYTKRQDYPEYEQLLRSFRPHVVHTHRYLAEFLSAHHVTRDVAYVCHGHDNMVQFAPLTPAALFRKAALTNRLEKAYLISRKYRRARTWFVANSTHTLRYYQAVLPRFMRDDVRLLQYGFDYGRFRSDTIRAPSPGEPLRIINVGSFQEKKNQIFIVRIADELRKAGLDFQVDLLGDGALRPTVQQAVERMGLQDRIFLRGNVDRVEDWLRRSHVYLHTAVYEPFGLVLLEAMAAGLPCVVLDGKGNRDILQHGRNGFVFEAQDAGAFAACLGELARSPESYTAMASHARAFASDFDIAPVADRFVAFYRDCLSRVPSASSPA